ncbi:MAG: hypothetical protein HY862_05710 [Chloroflexi bacterium]|nr:hypothetical protein [Chloroflexota bacterium]
MFEATIHRLSATHRLALDDLLYEVELGQPSPLHDLKSDGGIARSHQSSETTPRSGLLHPVSGFLLA